METGRGKGERANERRGEHDKKKYKNYRKKLTCKNNDDT